MVSLFTGETRLGLSELFVESRQVQVKSESSVG